MEKISQLDGHPNAEVRHAFNALFLAGNEMEEDLYLYENDFKWCWFDILHFFFWNTEFPQERC